MIQSLSLWAIQSASVVGVGIYITIVSSRAVSRRALSHCLYCQVCRRQKRQTHRSGPPVSPIDLSWRLPGELIYAAIGWFHWVSWHCGIVRSSWICRGAWKQEVARNQGDLSDESARRSDCVALHQRCGRSLFRASYAQRGSRLGCCECSSSKKGKMSARQDSELRNKILLSEFFIRKKKQMLRTPRARLRIIL